MSSARVKVNGVHLQYDRFGRGEPLVLIHGLGERKEGWRAQHELAEHYDLIIPDLRGFGKSELGDEKLTVELFAKDITGLLNHLQVRRAHFCGVSMGSVIAMEIYRRAPQLAQSLILANSFYYFPKFLGKWVLYTRLRKMKKMDPDEYKLAIIKKCLHSHREDILQLALVSCSDNQDAYCQAAFACLVDYRKFLSKINLPVLIIGCKEDQITPFSQQQKMHALIAHSELAAIEGAGHGGKFEKPVEFNDAVCQFLSKIKINKI